MTTTLYFLQVNRDVKDMCEESESTNSLYNFLVKDLLKILLDKTIKEEGVDVNRDEPKVKNGEEPKMKKRS